jgi:hypothetical protein
VKPDDQLALDVAVLNSAHLALLYVPVDEIAIRLKVGVEVVIDGTDREIGLGCDGHARTSDFMMRQGSPAERQLLRLVSGPLREADEQAVSR